MSAPTTDMGTVQQVIRALRQGDWSPVAVDNGEERVPVASEPQAIRAIFEVDMARLYFRHDDGRTGWTLFVLGNGDPMDCMADYTLTLSDVLDPLIDRWFRS
jgi:hypothetical protein